MRNYNFITVATFSILLGIVFQGPFSKSFGWHEGLGITDQKATEMYNNKTLSPETLKLKNSILNWKAGLQWQLDFIDIFCFGDTPSNPDSPNCLETMKVVYDNCYHHPNIDTECANPKIEEYMIKHNISGTYGSNYTKLQPIDPNKPTLKEMRASMIEKTRQLCIEAAISCENLPSK